MQASALLFDTLAREGLERLDDTGVPFDPTTHEAVEHEPADEDAVGGGNAAGAANQAEFAGEPEDHESSEPGGGSDPRGEARSQDGVQTAGPMVVAVLRAGYRWKGKEIRPPMVRVRG